MMGCVLLLLGFLSSARAGDLYHHLELALVSNPEIAAQRLAIEAAEHRVKQSGVLPDPRLALGGAISPIQTKDGPQLAKISVSQQLPWFGSLKIEKEIAGIEVDRHRRLFEEKVFAVWMKVIEQWLLISELQMTLVEINKNSEILSIYLNMIREKYRQGSAGMVDILLVERMIEDNNLKIQILNDEIEVRETYFRQLIGGGVSLTIPVDIRFPSLDTSEQHVDYDPRLAWYNKTLAQIEQQEKLIRKQNKPSLQIGLDYMVIGAQSPSEMDTTGRDAIMPMLGISLPVYRQRNTSKIELISLEKQILDLNKLDYEESYHSLRVDLLSQMKQQQTRLQSVDTQIQLQQERLRIFETDYQNTGMTLESILRAEKELLALRIQRINHQKEYLLAKARHNQLRGVRYVDF